MRFRPVVRVSVLALLVSAACAGTQQAPDTADVSAASLRATLEALASDAAEGRLTGSPAGLRAAEWLAGALEQAGVQPAGDDGSFLQAIDRVGFSFEGEPALSWTDAAGARTAAARGPDFDVVGGPPATLELAVVVANPEKDPPLPPRADAALVLQGGRRVRDPWLKAGGAPDGVGWGALLFPTTQPAREAPSGTALVKTAADGTLTGPPRVVVRGALREALLAGRVVALSLDVRAGPMRRAFNVVGRLPGAGSAQRPEAASEAVVFSAHYDHLGLRAAPPGEPAADLVFNGADDDASGCAAVVELARVFGAEARAGRPPARTLIFLLATGEEQGLHGTSFHLDHPAAPLDRTVMNLNFEMIGRPDPLGGGPGGLWLTGFELSTAGATWAAAGLRIGPDKRPEQHFYERSDNYAFVERGVVGQSLSSYDMHEDYHTVNDEIEGLDFAHMETAVRTSLAAARSLADGSLTPAWIKEAARPAAPGPN